MEELQLMVKARLAMMCNIINNGMLEDHLRHTLLQNYINRSDVDLLVSIMRKFLEAKPLVDELVRRGTQEMEMFKNVPKN